MTDRMQLHLRAVDAADRAVTALPADRLAKPSQCQGWSNSDLIAHMVGQNLGFAEAIGTGDAARSAYEPRSPQRWDESVHALRAALAAPAENIHLIEVAPDRLLPLSSVLGIHALDLTVHIWDLDPTYRPDADLILLVRSLAQHIPPRDGTGGSFAPATTIVDPDPWAQALALLGRNPG